MCSFQASPAARVATPHLQPAGLLHVGTGGFMTQKFVRGLVILAVALGILFGGRALGLPEPLLIGAIVILAVFTRLFVRGR